VKKPVSNIRNAVWSVLISGSVAVFFAPTPVVAEIVTLRMCYEDQPYFPFLGEIGNDDDDYPGILLEHINQAIGQLSLTSTMIRAPWKRCLKMLEHNEVDATFAAIYTPERERFARFPMANGKPDSARAIQHVEYPVFSRNQRPDIWDGKSFSSTNLVVAAPLGYVAAEMLKKSGHDPDFNVPLVDGLKLVAKDRLDGFVVERFIGLKTMEFLKLSDELRPSGKPYLVADWFVILSHGFYKKYPELSEQFWTEIGMSRTRNNRQLIKKYLARKPGHN
jgi:polar amino acid transport system substrate-binding protein